MVRKHSTTIEFGHRGALIPQPGEPQLSIWVCIAVLGHREPVITPGKNITTRRITTSKNPRRMLTTTSSQRITQNIEQHDIYYIEEELP